MRAMWRKLNDAFRGSFSADAYDQPWPSPWQRFFMGSTTARDHYFPWDFSNNKRFIKVFTNMSLLR